MKLKFLTIVLVIICIFCTNRDSTSEVNQNNPCRKPAKNVAIIGDSQSAGPYGQHLAMLIDKNSSAKLRFFGAACSARIKHWSDGGFTPIPSSCSFACESTAKNTAGCSPKQVPGKKTVSIKNILSKQPDVDLFIISLGDNNLSDKKDAIVLQMTNLVKPIIDAKKLCIWVSPTIGLGKYANKESFIAALVYGLKHIKKTFGRGCYFIDSYHLDKDVLLSANDLEIIKSSLEKDKMKIHPQGEGAKLWAKRVFEQLQLKGLIGKN